LRHSGWRSEASASESKIMSEHQSRVLGIKCRKRLVICGLPKYRD
jgi:hypothetical protein